MDEDEDSGFTSSNEEPRFVAPQDNNAFNRVAVAGSTPVDLENVGTCSLGLDELRYRARNHVQEFIRGMPMSQKVAYIEAVSKAPDIVSFETDSLQFVRCCNYDVSAAAERLVLYWKERKEVFGANRAFLPLVLTGKGALSTTDVMQLKAGFPTLLPKTRSGQCVVYWDRRQMVQTACANTRNRCAFYLAHLLSKNDIAQADGVLLLVLVTMPRLLGYDRVETLKALYLAKKVYPIKTKLHLLNFLPKNAAKRYEVQDIITSFVANAIDVGFDSTDTLIHFEREDGQILEELMAVGLSKEGIPTEFGGSWTFEQFAKWCRERAAIERRNYRKRLKKPPSQGPSHNHTNNTRTSPGADDQQTPPPSSVARSPGKQEAKLVKLRACNAVHSRRKRERRKQEFMDLQEKCTKFEIERSLLEAENSRLFRLLKRARTMVGEFDCADESQPPQPE
ncbi:hypothetical protein ACA910_011653 [Epithemia clementina (nom. ined.)]